MTDALCAGPDTSLCPSMGDDSWWDRCCGVRCWYPWQCGPIAARMEAAKLLYDRKPRPVCPPSR